MNITISIACLDAEEAACVMRRLQDNYDGYCGGEDGDISFPFPTAVEVQKSIEPAPAPGAKKDVPQVTHSFPPTNEPTADPVVTIDLVRECAAKVVEKLGRAEAAPLLDAVKQKFLVKRFDQLKDEQLPVVVAELEALL
jgi:hypothetical protein